MLYIDKLEHIKNNISSQSLTLINDFININKTLDDVESLHLYLVDNVLKILSKECDPLNSTLCHNTINIKEMIEKANHGRTGASMYFFNKNIPYYIVGDIHSDTKSILRLLYKMDFMNRVLNNEDFSIVFLGDYVDRGACHLKTIELILILKYLFPRNIFLLKGNHDGGELLENATYKLCVGRNSNTTDNDYFVAYVYNMLQENNRSFSLLKGYLDFFDNLPTKAFILSGKEILLCTHGGIPRPIDNNFNYINVLSDLTDHSLVDDIGRTIVHNMLWSDPSEEKIEELVQKGRFKFDLNHFNDFVSKIGITKLIRGHQAFEEGYKEFFNGALISIFSSGTLYDECNSININDETAYNDISPLIISFKSGSKEIIKL